MSPSASTTTTRPARAKRAPKMPAQPKGGAKASRAKSAEGPKPSPYEKVTDRLIALMEQGVPPWKQPWPQGGAPRNLVSRHPYRGANLLVTLCAGYGSPWWATYNQIQKLGGRVLKGERATFVFFWRPWTPGGGSKALAPASAAAPAPAGEEEHQDPTEEQVMAAPGTRSFLIARAYPVWNLEQTEGLSAPASSAGSGPAVTAPAFTPIEQAEQIVAAMPNPPKIIEGGHQAYYTISGADEIHVPKRATFERVEAFYGTLYHEMTHSTAAKHRLNREIASNFDHFGSERYSREELVAQLGSAWLAHEADIDTEAETEQSAAYLAHWLGVLKGDRRLLVIAAGQAQRAVDHILNRQTKA